MIAACQRHGKFSGLLVPNVAAAKEWIAKGIRLVPCSSDVSYLLNAAASATAPIKAYAETMSWPGVRLLRRKCWRPDPQAPDS